MAALAWEESEKTMKKGIGVVTKNVMPNSLAFQEGIWDHVQALLSKSRGVLTSTGDIVEWWCKHLKELLKLLGISSLLEAVLEMLSIL